MGSTRVQNWPFPGGREQPRSLRPESYLEQTDYAVLDGDLPISTAYGIAHDAGKALTETAYPTLNEKAEHLAQAIIDRLVALTDAKEAS